MAIDCLTDKSKIMICLLNCKVHQNKWITVGFSYFRGGLSGKMSIFDYNGREYVIRIPDSVKECDTEVIRVSRYDDIKIYLAN